MRFNARDEGRKGGKDRVVMLPHSLEAALRVQLASSRALWTADRNAQRPGVFLPHALEVQVPSCWAVVGMALGVRISHVGD